MMDVGGKSVISEIHVLGACVVNFLSLARKSEGLWEISGLNFSQRDCLSLPFVK